jgi:hypothetical protein
MIYNTTSMSSWGYSKIEPKRSPHPFRRTVHPSLDGEIEPLLAAVCVGLVRRSQAISRAEFHFHAELNDFLAPARRGAAVTYRFGGRVSIKDAIESLGVPHTKIEAIVVGSTAVDFAYIVRDSDRVEVFPSPAPAAHAALRPPFPG